MKTPVVCTKCNSVCYSEVGLCRKCKPRAVRDCSAEYLRLVSRLKEKGTYEQFREKNKQRYSEYNKKYYVENRDRINQKNRERYRALHPIKERTKKNRYIPTIHHLSKKERFGHTLKSKYDGMPISSVSL